MGKFAVYLGISAYRPPSNHVYYFVTRLPVARASTRTSSCKFIPVYSVGHISVESNKNTGCVEAVLLRFYYRAVIFVMNQPLLAFIAKKKLK
jgi:hypothetical protein